MNYDLAASLKEAGFPQEYQKSKPIMDWAFDEMKELHLLHSDNDTGWWIGNDYGKSANMSIEEVQKNWVKCPTLYDLIKELGDTFVSLEKLYTPDEVGMWWAKSNTGYECIGDSPDSAVANLYIAINKTPRS